MRNDKNFHRLMMLVWCIALMSFSCATTKNNSVTMPRLHPPIPAAPVMERVRFEDKADGLWLSYDQYRLLERNIIALQEYAAKLKTVVEFYREDAGD